MVHDFFRETARYLVVANDTLQSQVQQTEKDTIDVVTYLKRQDQEKDKQVSCKLFNMGLSTAQQLSSGTCTYCTIFKISFGTTYF